MNRNRLSLVAALILALSGAFAAQRAAAAPWDARAAEHLLNRAGFGASPAEIERALAAGRAATLDGLFAERAPEPGPYWVRLRQTQGMRAKILGMEQEERQAMNRKLRREDTRQLRDYLAWWGERLVTTEDVLRERMTLFWHGYFTSSFQDVRNSHEMIVQNQLLREHALGRFGPLLHAIARDPAMLEYLDNASNRKGKPNENFAREVMELFTLGEGNYTENDVKEAARAFTGWTDRNGEFRFARRVHDASEKTVLGVTGNFDGQDVLDLLLAQEACARHLAGKLIAYFEGRAPEETRLERYAAQLRSSDYDVGALLRTLFEDPDFYRGAIVGARIASPVDYLVGSARRLGIEPPALLLVGGSAALGERLLFPPNVKGWEGGTAWITTATLMQRGNLAGVMLGAVTPDDVLRVDDPAGLADEASDDERMDGETMDAEEPARARRPNFGELGQLRQLKRLGWRPRLSLTARLQQLEAHDDEAVVAALTDDLLAIEAPAATRAELVRVLRDERMQAGLDEGRLLDEPLEAEPLLRRLAHVILSLPEAQLH